MLTDNSIELRPPSPFGWRPTATLHPAGCLTPSYSYHPLPLYSSMRDNIGGAHQNRLRPQKGGASSLKPANSQSSGLKRPCMIRDKEDAYICFFLGCAATNTYKAQVSSQRKHPKQPGAARVAHNHNEHHKHPKATGKTNTKKQEQQINRCTGQPQRANGKPLEGGVP